MSWGSSASERPSQGRPILETGVLGHIGDLPELVRRQRVDRVVVDLAEARGRLPVDALLDVRLRGIPVDHLASAYERYTGKIALAAALRPSWLIFSPGFRHTRLLTAAKRTLDVGAASIGLLIALPLAAIVAVAVKLTSPGRRSTRSAASARTAACSPFTSFDRCGWTRSWRAVPSGQRRMTRASPRSGKS